MRGKIIVCGSQKGGVGKTVTTFNLAYALTSLGKDVLSWRKDICNMISGKRLPERWDIL